jgi:hypothetical protein
MNTNSRQFFAPGVSLHLVGPAAFVLNESMQAIYKLNSAGALIWCFCEDNSEPGAVVSAIESGLSITRPEAEACLEAAVAQWSELGLTAAAVPDRTDFDVRPILESSPRNDSHADGVGERKDAWNMHVLGQRTFKVLYACAEQEKWGSEAFGRSSNHDDYVARRELGQKLTVLEVRAQRRRRYLVLRDNVQIYENLKKEYVIPVLKRLMMVEAVQSPGCTLAVHAGVVHRNGRAIILPAPSGSGKTTLVAGLISAGFGYLSDEIALISADLQVQPLPMNLCIKQNAWNLISELYPCLARASTHRRMHDGNFVRYLKAPRSSLLRGDESVPLTRIVFPRYVPECRANIRQLEPHTGIEMLLAESVLPRHLDGQTFNRLFEKLQRCSYYMMKSPSLSESIGLIEGLG